MRFTIKALTCLFGFAFALAVLIFVVKHYGAPEVIDEGSNSVGSIQEFMNIPKKNKDITTSIPRKLLTSTDDEDDEDEDGSNNRIPRTEDSCSKTSIGVFQGQTAPLPNGIPTYTVQVENACVSGRCIVSDIHLNCGWFSSARLINPSVFRRISYDDCLVKDGQPIGPGETISFQYANTFEYPLSVSSVSCD